jgi:hypothetical protein
LVVAVEDLQSLLRFLPHREDQAVVGQTLQVLMLRPQTEQLDKEIMAVLLHHSLLELVAAVVVLEQLVVRLPTATAAARAGMD